MEPKWQIVLSGPERNDIVEGYLYGRQLILDLRLDVDGTLTQAVYDWTGICHDQRVAFARFTKRERFN